MKQKEYEQMVQKYLNEEHKGKTMIDKKTLDWWMCLTDKERFEIIEKAYKSKKIYKYIKL